MNTSQDKKPYLVDAVIGNSRMLASLGQTGRMYRLWWPNIDSPQHIDEIRSGLFIHGANEYTNWFDQADNGWVHDTEYVPQTNILHVHASSTPCPIEVDQHDFSVPGKDLLVRLYAFKNLSEKPVTFSFMYYSSLYMTENRLYNTTRFIEDHDALVHFRHQYYFAVSSTMVCTGFQSGFAWEQACSNTLNGSLIDMAGDGALSWTFEQIAPGQTVQLPIYVAAGSNLDEALDLIAEAKSHSISYWYSRTEKYWHDFLQAANSYPGNEPDLRELYDRSLLTMKLMCDERTGSIIAAPEFDESFSRCGGYSFCWGRDAAFITTALDKAGLTELSARFYDWALTAQDRDGSWQQRHYHDGSLAPSWGLQIDEGASILWGMWQHYIVTQDSTFLERIWPSVERGAGFLVGFIDEETGLPLPSRDLWEEREAEHTYSAAAVYGGLTAAASFAEVCGHHQQAEVWRAVAQRIQQAITELCWNEQAGTFYRALKWTVYDWQYQQACNKGLQGYIQTSAKGYDKHVLQYDPTVDVSLLGLFVPFRAIPIDHKYAQLTADCIERELTVPGLGGIQRYEDDTYIGGNPWILTTLWLAQYRILNQQPAEAEALLHWAADHRTTLGLLPEQVDKHTGATAWVVPLTWSHAMFVLAVHMLAETKLKENLSK
jgi:glucoamylase